MKRRIAVIGLGMAVTPHAKGLIDLADRVEVVWAASRTQDRCDQFAAQFPFPTTTDIDQIFADSSIDAVAILSPPNSHLDLVRRAAAAGKHVFLEKPLEVDLSRARELVSAARDAGITTGVVLQSRFRESSRTLRQLLDDGALGTIAAAYVAVPWWRPQSYYDEPGRGTKARDGGGALITQAIHPLDLFQSLVGGVRAVSAVSGTTAMHDMECEDFAAAGMILSNGAPAGLLATTAQFPGDAEHIDIIGTLGTARLSGEVLDLAYHEGRTERIGSPAKTGGGSDPMDFPHDAHRAVMEDFLDALDGDRAPLVPVAEALKVHFLIDALLESAASGARVEVPDRVETTRGGRLGIGG